MPITWMFNALTLAYFIALNVILLPQFVLLTSHLLWRLNAIYAAWPMPFGTISNMNAPTFPLLHCVLLIPAIGI